MAIDPVSISLLAGGLALNVGRSIYSNLNKSDKIRHQEKFRQALQDIQTSTLESVYARKDYSTSIAENITLGRQASSFSKNRIGVAGTSQPAFSTILENFQRQKEGQYLELREQIAKLATQRRSSEIADKNSFDIGAVVFDGVKSAVDTANTLVKIQESDGTGTSRTKYTDRGVRTNAPAPPEFTDNKFDVIDTPSSNDLSSFGSSNTRNV